MSYLLGLDVGTSGAKVVLIDDTGTLLAKHTQEYPILCPQPLWSEQHPTDWWLASHKAICTILTQSAIDPTLIAGLGLTGQMHGSVFLDVLGRPIRPALLWNDQRTIAECEEIHRYVGSRQLIAITGNPALTGFQAPKILWLRNHEPANYKRISHILLPKDYIRYCLSGTFITDASDAAGTLLLDLRTRDWSSEILHCLDIPRAWLPAVYEGTTITGHILPSVAASTGLPDGLPIVAGGSDNAVAAIGTGVIRSGIVSSSIGTSGVLFAHCHDISFDPQGRLHTFCHAIPNAYHVMGVTLSAGGSFQWLRNFFDCTNEKAPTYDQLTTEAADIPPGAEGLIFLPYLSGERAPHLDPLARGAFIGLTSRHTRAHLVRAVMEGVVYSLRDSLELMRALGIPINHIRATGGGGRSVLWRQMQADIYGVEVATLEVEEGPAYGAALLAGVGTGVFRSINEAVDMVVRVRTKTQPAPVAQERYNQYYVIYRQLYATLRESMQGLSKLTLSVV